MSIPLLGPTIPPFSQYFQEQSSMAAPRTYDQITLAGPTPWPSYATPPASHIEFSREDQEPDASEKHGLRHLLSRVYLDGIYVLFERERRKEVDVPVAAHLRSYQQRMEAEIYREMQAEKAKKAVLKAQLAAEKAERRRLRGGSNASTFSLRRMSSSLNRFCSRVRSGQNALDRVREQPSRGPSSANLRGLTAAGGAQEGGPGDHQHRVPNTPTSSPSSAVAVTGPSRSPSSGSPKAIGTRAITRGRPDSGTQEFCQPGANLDEGRMGRVLREKVSMASSRSKYSQPESAEIVGQRKREPEVQVDEDEIQVIGRV
ncbi:MAG: hypothetical protein Q9228_002622 [Teloschistes exilis]